MRGHNIGLYGEIRKIIPKLALLPHLIWSSDMRRGFDDDSGIMFLFLHKNVLYHPITCIPILG